MDVNSEQVGGLGHIFELLQEGKKKGMYADFTVTRSTLEQVFT